MRKFTFIKSLFLAVALIASYSVKAETATLTITRSSFPSGSLVYNVTDMWSATTSKGDVIAGEGDLYSTASQTTLQSKNTGVSTMYHNTTQIPGPITKIILTGASGTSTRTYTVYTSTNSTITSTAGGTSKGTIAPAAGSSASLSLDASENWRYFWLDLAGGGSTLTSIVIEYEVIATTPTVATPQISATGVQKATDNFYNSATVTLSSTTDGASIYYTTNGDAPTTASTAYSAPFEITATSTIKAIAVKDGLDNSTVAEKNITISTPATATVPYTEAFNNTLGDWIAYEVVGAKPWTASANGATVNGYGGVDVESWLISPKFTAVGDGIALAFNYASKYIGNPVSVKMSSNYIGYGNPSAATWTELSSIAAPTVQDNAYTVKATGDIVAATTGTVYFALVYDADANFSDWRITNATVNNYTTPTAPTLTVTELTVPEMTAVTGLTDTETVNVSGAALTADILVTIDGADAAMFSVLPPSIAQTAGEASGAVTVTYSPTAPGTHTATLKFNSTGATEVTRTLTGTSTMATPVAIDGSGISQTGFTANWNAVAGATEYELNVYTKQSSSVNASDLFISEYIEGSSNNKAIEIFNGTGADVNLSTYKVELYNNGSTTVGTTVTLTGTLANNDVYVIYNSSASAEIQALGDISNGVANFNGDDAIVLKNGDNIIDIFGRLGNDPGTAWTADGGYSSVDKTLRRKSSVYAGVTVSPTGTGATAFTTLATEWDVYAIDNIDNLGSHTFAGSSVVSTPIAGSPFTVTGETSKAITDLTAGTTYYYTVVAKNGSAVTAASNEIAVTTSTGTGLSNAVQNMSLRAVNGNIVLNTEAGQLVEVYNSIGQKLASHLTTQGINTIPARVKGVVFVKIGSEVSKLIME